MSKESADAALKAIKDYEKTVDDALKRFSRRTGYEPSTDETPLSHLIAETEDGGLDEWSIRNETARTILGWIAADGPHPASLLRRLMLLGDHMMVPPYCQLTLREKALMSADSASGHHWRMKRVCVDPLIRRGAASVKAPGQKGGNAAAAASKAQKGNHNRANGHAAAGKAKRRNKTRPK